MLEICRIFETGSQETGGGILKAHFRFQGHRIPGKRDGHDLPDFGGNFESARDRFQGDPDEGQHRRSRSGQSQVWRRADSGKKILNATFKYGIPT